MLSESHGQYGIVTFLEDCPYSTSSGASDSVPKGTRLIGEWEPQQSEGASARVFMVNGVTWNLRSDQVRMTDWDQALTQEQIAREDEEAANREDKQENFAAAQVLYARAVIEYEAAGWTETRLSTLRMRRAGVLLALAKHTDAASELERAGHALEEQAHNPYNRMAGIYLDYAEQAVDALLPLALVSLRHLHDTAQARRVVDRLLSLNSLIKKRYERKVELLLYIVEFLLDLEEQDKARSYFEQANRFYSQQLANMEDFPNIAVIAAHLKKVKQRLQGAKQPQTIRFSVTTKTPDELDALLALLQKSQIGIEVTKGPTAQRMSKDSRAGIVYVANLRLIHHPVKEEETVEPSE